MKQILSNPSRFGLAHSHRPEMKLSQSSLMRGGLLLTGSVGIAAISITPVLFPINLRLFSTTKAKWNNHSNSVGGTGNNYPFKLVINSTYDNLVFTNGKSIWFLPSIYLLLNPENIPRNLYSNGEFSSEYEDSDLEVESYFFIQLNKIFINLEDGEYYFEFYFYVESISPLFPVRYFYSLEAKQAVDMDYLIKRDKGSSGYKRLIKITLPLFNCNSSLQLMYIAGELGRCLDSLKSIPDFKVFHEDIQQQVLLVISQNKKYNDKDLESILKKGFFMANSATNSSILPFGSRSIEEISELVGFNSTNTNTPSPLKIPAKLVGRRGIPLLIMSRHSITVGNKHTQLVNSILPSVQQNSLFSHLAFHNQALSANPKKSMVNNPPSDIITKTLSGKERQFHIWMDFKLALFDLEYYIQQITEHPLFSYGVRYSVLTKVERFEIYRTVIPSFSVYCKERNPKYLSDLENIHDILGVVMEEFQNQYKEKAISNPDSLVLSFFSVSVEKKYFLSEKIKSLLTEVKYKNTVKELNLFDYKLLDNPNLTNNQNWNGLQPLKWDGEFLDTFDEQLNEFNTEYLLETINRHRPHISYNLYLKKYKGKTHVLINLKLAEGLFLRKAFNNKGFKVSEVLDTYLNNQIIKRASGNFIYKYENNRILSLEKLIKFKPIKYINKPSDSFLPNQSFGTLDIETFINKEGKARCYSIGYYIHDPREENYFYINKDLDSFELIHRCFEKLLVDKHKKRIFYVHNLGKFDGVFIIKALSTYNKYLDNPYYFDTVNRNGDFIKLVIKRRINQKVRTVSLLDSWALLPLSLRNLCKAYEVKITKSFFPYSFVNESTLWYKGNTPAKTYYPSNLSSKEYKKLTKTNWELMYETLIYLRLDLKSLHEVLRVVNRNIFMMLGIQMTESNTSTSLGLKILYTKFNTPNLIIPSITDKEIYTDINNSYYGGRVEVFKPHGKNLFYYDVNSLYPFAALNTLCGLNANYVEYLQIKKDINELFGFFYCKITTPKDYISKYLGLLPHRNSDGSLSFPVGCWNGWYFSEELKYAKSLGYEIQVFKGYNFEKIESPFKPYITQLNSIKQNPRNTAERQISKLLMNSPIGRFGMNPEKSISELVNVEKHNFIATTRVLYDSIPITKELFLDTFSPFISKEICTKYEVDYFKVRNSINSREKNREYQDFSSIVTASAILGYARIYMAKALVYVLNNGGKVYYTDTDSIVIDIKLPDDWVSPSEIGKFKLEHEVIEAYFLADKFYSLKTTEIEKGQYKIVTRTKGLSRDSVSWEKIKELYETGEKLTSTKLSSKKNVQEGSVVIEPSDIVLNLIYKKRKKIFEKGRWIDTVPWVINPTTLTQNKSLIIYNSNRKLFSGFVPNKSLITYNDRYKDRTFNLIPYVIYIHPLNLILYNHLIKPWV